VQITLGQTVNLLNTLAIKDRKHISIQLGMVKRCLGKITFIMKIAQHLKIEKMDSKYNCMWMALVKVYPQNGYAFVDLIDSDGNQDNKQYVGAWGNVIVKAADIAEAIPVIHAGMEEKHFKVAHINRIENVGSQIDEGLLSEDVLEEINWLNRNDYQFLISDALFPFEEEP
jgi:hypothetical protein